MFSERVIITKQFGCERHELRKVLKTKALKGRYLPIVARDYTSHKAVYNIQSHIKQGTSHNSYL
jgi:hypothetical protein